MADVTVRRIDEMESTGNGGFVRARAELGVSSFGMQVINLPPNADGYPEHSHDTDGQEEVYIPLKGSVTLLAGEEKHSLAPGQMARVGPGQTRKLVTGADAAQILALGGVPGGAYTPPPFTEIGA